MEAGLEDGESFTASVEIPSSSSSSITTTAAAASLDASAFSPPTSFPVSDNVSSALASSTSFWLSVKSFVAGFSGAVLAAFFDNDPTSAAFCEEAKEVAVEEETFFFIASDDLENDDAVDDLEEDALPLTASLGVEVDMRGLMTEPEVTPVDLPVVDDLEDDVVVVFLTTPPLTDRLGVEVGVRPPEMVVVAEDAEEEDEEEEVPGGETCAVVVVVFFDASSPSPKLEERSEESLEEIISAEATSSFELRFVVFAVAVDAFTLETASFFSVEDSLARAFVPLPLSFDANDDDVDLSSFLFDDEVERDSAEILGEERPLGNVDLPTVSTAL